MVIDKIKKDFRDRVSDQIDLQPEGHDRFLVLTPFRFDDGDHFGIFLKREASGWILTDEASTLQHLSYEIDEDRLINGGRADLINASLAGFFVENRDGELRIPVAEEGFGDALFSFVQALTKVSDVSYLSVERVKSTFLEDLKTFLRQEIPTERLYFDWTNPEFDQAKKYPVDAYINTMRRPLLVYGLQNDEKVSLATISLLMFEKWGMQFQSMAVFEAQENVAAKTVARLTDVCEKPFSNLEGNKDRIAKYLKQALILGK